MPPPVPGSVAIGTEVGRTALRVLCRPGELAATAGLALAFCLLAERRSSSSIEWLSLVPLFIALAAVTVLDVRTRVIPDLITLPALAYAFAWATIVPGAPGLANAALGILVGGGTVLGVAIVTRGGIGGGDIKLMALLGAALGWRGALVVLALSQLVGAAVALAILIGRRRRDQSGLPVGALMALFGALILGLRH